METLRVKYEKLGKKCFYCERHMPFSRITRDHIIPKSKGGTLKHAVFACHRCNQMKANLSLQQFRDKVWDYYMKQLKPKQHYSATTIINNIDKLIENENKGMYL